MPYLSRLSTRLALRVTRTAIAVVAMTAIAACSTQDGGPLAPAAPAPQANAGLISSLLGILLPVKGVTRNTPLAADVVASAQIGAAGGRISVPGTGLTLIVPAGAVAANTNFSVTAKAGRLVAYEFEPHGAKFPVPLRFVQDLRGTSAGGLLGGLTLGVGYFADASQLDDRQGTGLVNELLGVTLNLLGHEVTANIHHFSGYLVSSGRR
jgi:hypothetical protein